MEPTMIQDAQGHYLSGATEATVTTFYQAVRAFNLVHGDAIGLFDAAREAAPDFTMAHIGKAWVSAVLPQFEILRDMERWADGFLTGAAAASLIAITEIAAVLLARAI
jgi:hypothetical protein